MPFDSIHDELDADQWLEWYRMTPQERWEESERLWDLFLRTGGSLEPEPDPDSPFYADIAPSPAPAYGRSGVHVVRRGPV